MFKRTSQVDQLVTDLYQSIESTIEGRIATSLGACQTLGQAAALSPKGDHLEIGTLYGGTAILVALLNRKLNRPGKVYCVDPLEGYYETGRADPLSTAPVNESTFRENIRRFGLEDRVVLIKKKSFPFPTELTGMAFSTVLIDGDHWGLAPLIDFDSVRNRTTGFVLFDDYDDRHAAVVKAVKMVQKDYPSWTLVYIHNTMCVMGKVEIGDPYAPGR